MTLTNDTKRWCLMVHILLFYVAYTKYAMVGQSREHAALALLGQIYNPKCRLLKAAREAEREREKKTNMQSDWPSTKINQSLQRQTRSEGQQVHQVNRIHYYCGGTTALRKWRRRKSTNLKTVKKHRDGHLEYFVFWLRSVGPLLLIFFCNCVIWSSNLFRWYYSDFGFCNSWQGICQWCLKPTVTPVSGAW